MARRGFFLRAYDAIRRVAFPVLPEIGKGKKPRRAAPTSSPEPEPRRRRAPTSGYVDPFQQAWVEETLRRPGTREYRAQRAYIEGLYGFSSQTREDQLMLWREFIKFNQRGGGSQYLRKDPRHPFWHAAGIHPDNFNWAEWRAMMKAAGSP